MAKKPELAGLFHPFYNGETTNRSRDREGVWMKKPWNVTHAHLGEYRIRPNNNQPFGEYIKSTLSHFLFHFI